jgi:hypothetical protein
MWSHLGARLLVVLKSDVLLQNNTHFENHSWLYRSDEFRWSYDLAVSCTNYLIVTPLDEMIPDVIVAIAINDIVKTLLCRDE